MEVNIKMKKCKNCGKLIPEYAKYCAFCRQNQAKEPGEGTVDFSAVTDTVKNAASQAKDTISNAAASARDSVSNATDAKEETSRAEAYTSNQPESADTNAGESANSATAYTSEPVNNASDKYTYTDNSYTSAPFDNTQTASGSSDSTTRYILIAIIGVLAVVVIFLGIRLAGAKSEKTQVAKQTTVAESDNAADEDSAEDSDDVSEDADDESDDYDTDSDDEYSDDSTDSDEDYSDDDYSDEDYDDTDEEYDDEDTDEDSSYLDELNLDGSDSSTYPDFSAELLTDDYVSGLSDDELQLTINTLYAAKGYHFKSEELQDYFGAKDWYTDDGITDQKEIKDSLDKTELKNWEKLTKERNSR